MRKIVVLVFDTVIESDDGDGGYETTDADVSTQDVLGRVVEQLGRTESGTGFDATVYVEGKPAWVKFQWESAFELDPAEVRAAARGEGESKQYLIELVERLER